RADTPCTCACSRDGDGRRGTAAATRDVSDMAGARPLLRIPAKHGWGRYYADEQTLAAMDSAGQVVLRYAPGSNFNGSVDEIAGVCNRTGNVFGLMPHPEHAVDELIGGSTDGLAVFEAIRIGGEGARG